MIPAPPTGICPNCWRTALAQPGEVSEVRCHHLGVRAVRIPTGWTTYALASKAHKVKRQAADAGRAHITSLFRRPGAL